MTWELYKLRFRLLSPLHVGRSKIGNIQIARSYVMARQMWGAVTARLTRSALYGEWTPPSNVPVGNYVRMGELVKEQLAFTYIYPEDESGRPLFPCFTERGLMYGANGYALTEDVFAWRYLSSYASTALDYELNSAEEGTLHEVEYLLPQTRQDKLAESSGGNLAETSYPVYLTGYVFVTSDCALPWRRALSRIQIGGELKSGWGRLRLHHPPDQLAGEPLIFGLLQPDLNKPRPRVKASKDNPLLAHTVIGTVQPPIFKASGDIEPLVGREWCQNKGAGQKISKAAVCYAPGSIITDDGAHCFEMTTEHVWQPAFCE